MMLAALKQTISEIDKLEKSYKSSAKKTQKTGHFTFK